MPDQGFDGFRAILAVIVIAITASPSKAERVPVTCEQFIASINDGAKMVRKMSTEGRVETIVEGATIRLYSGITGIPVFQIEYPDL